MSIAAPFLRRDAVFVCASLFLLFVLPFVSAMDTFKCRVPRVVVTREVPGDGISTSDVEIMVGKNPDFVDPASTHWTCSDGLTNGEALATPGGDSGEFLMGLALYTAEVKKFNPGYELTRHEVYEMFDEFMANIDDTRGFYMHMDGNVYKALQEALVPVLGATPNIFYVPEPKQEQVMTYLTNPDYVGCAHMHAIMQFPTKYSIPRDTVTYFLQAFYHYLWNHENSHKLFLTITESVPTDGSRKEVAYIKLGADQSALDVADQCKNMAPVMAPKNAKGSIFLAQPQFVGGVRDSIVFFFSRKLQALVGEQDVSDINIAPQMAELAATHLQLSITNLAKGKPVYQVMLVLDNSSSVLRMLIAAIVGGILFIIIFGLITYIKYRQVHSDDHDYEV